MLKNNEQGFGLVSKLLHWGLALIIVLLIAVGLYMTGLEKEDPARLQIYGMHKAFGALVLLLTVVRISWLIYSRPPVLPAVLQVWEQKLSLLAKGLLYLLSLAVPSSGYVMSNAAGYSVSLFGLCDLPVLVAKNEELAKLANGAHGLLAYLLIGVVLLHVAGALKHRLLDKDPAADVMKRML